MEKEKKKRGGAGRGQGRKKIDGLKQRKVYLTDLDLEYLKQHHGGLTKAVRSLLNF